MHVPKGTEPIFEAQGIVVVIVRLDEPGLVGFELLLWVHIVGIFFDFMRLGLLAVVDTLLEVVLYNVHLSYDALQTDELVGEFAA